MKENAGYTIRRSILFDNACGVVLGENPHAPAPFVTGTTFGATITPTSNRPRLISLLGPGTISGSTACGLWRIPGYSPSSPRLPSR